jgi:hypothetical protein
MKALPIFWLQCNYSYLLFFKGKTATYLLFKQLVDIPPFYVGYVDECVLYIIEMDDVYV